MSKTSEHFSWLTTVPVGDVNFKSHLEDAPLEVLNDTLDHAGERNEKTRYKAVAAEIKRRLKEGNITMNVPTLAEWGEQRAAAAKEQENIVRTMQSAREGNAIAITYCHTNGIDFKSSPRPAAIPTSDLKVAPGQVSREIVADEILPPDSNHQHPSSHAPEPRSNRKGPLDAVREQQAKAPGSAGRAFSHRDADGESAGAVRGEDVQGLAEEALPGNPVGGRGDDDGPGARLADRGALAEAGRVGVGRVEPTWDAGRRFVDAAGKFEKCKLACQVMAGFVLIELRKTHGTNQGKRCDLGTSPIASEKLDWPKLVKQELGISDDTARNWMAMAKAAAPRIKKLGRFGDLPLLEPSKLTPQQEKDVEEIVRKLTDERTQLDFLRELGLCKKPQGSGAKGGANGVKGEGDSPQQAAIDLWTPLLKGLLVEGLAERSWVDLPDRGEISREALAGVLIDLAREPIAPGKKAHK